MFVLVPFVLVFVLIGGEPPNESNNLKATKNNMKTSTEDLLKMLPSLKPLEITACSYQKTFGTKKSELPSPSDTLVQVTGWIEVKGELFDKLMTHEKWEVLRPEQLPKELRSQMPGGGEFKTCKSLNVRFNSNPTIAHGMLVVSTSDKGNKFWLLAQDLDHPIDKSSP